MYYGCKLIISSLAVLLNGEPGAQVTRPSFSGSGPLFSVPAPSRLLVQAGRHNYNVITSGGTLGLTLVEHKALAGQKHARYIQLQRPAFPLPWSYFWGDCNAGTRCALACCRCTCTSARRGPFWRCRSYRPSVSSRLSASRSSRSPPPSFVHLRPPQRSRIAIRKSTGSTGNFLRLQILRRILPPRDRVRSISLIMRFNHRTFRLTGAIKLNAMGTTKTARVRMSPSINFQLTQHRDNVESFDINKSRTVSDAISSRRVSAVVFNKFVGKARVRRLNRITKYF